MTEMADRTRVMQFTIRYLSRYRYESDVVDNINALRVRPASTATQRVDDFTLRLTPDARQYRHEDYFGTEVVEFEVTRPHRELVIDALAHVRTETPAEPSGGGWEGLADAAYRDGGSEFVMQTDEAPGHPLLEELERELAGAGSPLEAVLLVAELIPGRLEYRKGATYVDSPLAHVLDIRAGVCQDFVHLGLHLLRRRGIAGRYVSGYLYTRGADENAGEQEASGEPSIEVDTHAWIEALVPQDQEQPRWIGIDPTNRGLAGERHVKIGHGRHYADVPPIKGVYRGMASSTLEASVTMTRL